MSTTNPNSHLTISIDRLPSYLKVFNDDTGEGDISERRLSCFILSPPGFGKTAQVSTYAKSIDAQLVTQVASTLDRLDVAGLPATVKDEVLGTITEFAPMRLMASLSKERNPNGGKAVLYFNELNAAPESVYPVLYRLFNERAICGLNLRDNVILVADGNPSSSASAGRDMQMALRRRFAWIVIEQNIPVWQKWALANGVDARVVTFFSDKLPFSQHFCDFNPKKRENLTFSCPASWTKLARKLDVILKEFIDPIERLTAFAGLVGMESATAFTAYIKHIDTLPDVEKILADPENIALPKKADELGLMVGALVNYVVKNPAKIDPALVLCARMASMDKGENAYPEFGVYLFRTLAQTGKPMLARINKSKLADNLIAIAGNDHEMMNALLQTREKTKAE